jgi:hypothetical protein
LKSHSKIGLVTVEIGRWTEKSAIWNLLERLWVTCGSTHASSLLGPRSSREERNARRRIPPHLGEENRRAQSPETTTGE